MKNQFIFSNKLKVRLARHVMFWSTYCLVSFFTDLYPATLNEFGSFLLYKSALLSILYFLPSAVFAVYFDIYILVPYLLLRKRYLLFFISLFALLIISFCFDFISGGFFFRLIHSNVIFAFGNIKAIAYRKSVQIGFTIVAIATCIKLGKYIYAQQLENTLLTAQQAEIKKQLIKTKIHDFVLYALHHIERKINAGANDAAEIILKLSDLLSYILYDCDEENILLKKEINAVENLINVEAIIKGCAKKINIALTEADLNKKVNSQALFSSLRTFFSKRKITPDYLSEISVDIFLRNNILYLNAKLINSAPGFMFNFHNKIIEKNNLLYNDVDEAENYMHVAAHVFTEPACKNEFA